MTEQLTISVDWEQLNEGEPEERACFAAVGIRHGDVWLTEGRDSLVNVVRRAPYVSAYHLAEWLVWNWWRLRWESHSSRENWPFAHRMSTIGSGYVWPNISVFSDGVKTAVVAKPTNENLNVPYRYISDRVAVLPATTLGDAIDNFVTTVLGRLASEGLGGTNLHALWHDLSSERSDPQLLRRRKLEALRGVEPDEIDPQVLGQLISDCEQLGEAAVSELAADQELVEIPTAAEFGAVALQTGTDTSPQQGFRLNSENALPQPSQVAAWRLGAQAASAVRNQEGLNGQPLSDDALCNLLAVQQQVLQGDSHHGTAFALDDENRNRGKIVLRSKWKEGRRFELARILGDRLINREGDRLFPASRSHTYRQKAQRSFAAELLSPFEAIDQFLSDDYSEESQQDAANYFDVSPLMIRTQLVNHGRISQDEFDIDFEVAAA